jgi:hypothetical protein
VRRHGQHARPRIALVSQQIASLASPLLATVQDCPAWHHWLTIPGVGKLWAMPIFYEIGAIARIQTTRACSSYGQLVPGVAQSSPVSRRGRHAQPGPPHLTWASRLAAFSAIRYDPKSRHGFARHLGRHCGKGSTRIADAIMAHKLAQAVYHILREDTGYQESRLLIASWTEGDRLPRFGWWICPARALNPHW